MLSEWLAVATVDHIPDEWHAGVIRRDAGKMLKAELVANILDTGAFSEYEDLAFRMELAPALQGVPLDAHELALERSA